MEELLSIKQASEWASGFLGKNVTASNISYLVNYGKIRKIGENGSTFVSKQDLVRYYETFYVNRESAWKNKLGDDLNWALSFDYLKETDTTKHVHRLHPYKGKFIPQLVEYFLDDHTDAFKTEVFFKKGDILLDPFCGSGTTLVQANELGMHAVGADISAFNSLISNVKLDRYDFDDVQRSVTKITAALKKFLEDKHSPQFENELAEKLNQFNTRFFPSPDFRYRVRQGAVAEKVFGGEKAAEFLPVYFSLVKKYDIALRQTHHETFLDRWYLQHVRSEIDFVRERVEAIENPRTRNVVRIILSRTMRSCRATTHSDLGTLVEPVTTPYYCPKHGKICRPLFSILSRWERYARDTVNRLRQFDALRTDTFQQCLTGDSRTINFQKSLADVAPEFAKLLKKKKFRGIFSSPPYVGLIDYHEQHAYAYDLFGFHRQDEKEIGAMQRGKNKSAKQAYVEGIAATLRNARPFLVDDFDIFLVANDKQNLYPEIAALAGMRIVNRFKRPVLNRTERDKGAYSEVIFHMKSI